MSYLVSASAGNSINLKSGSITVTTPGGGTATKTGFTFLKTPQQITFTPIPTQTYGGADLPNELYPGKTTYGYQLYTGVFSNYVNTYHQYNPDGYYYNDVYSSTILTSSNTAVATITASGGIHFTGAGTTTITAANPGNSIYAAATPVSQVLTVNLAPQTITFNAIPTKYLSDADFSPGATSNSGLTITYTSSDPSVATVVNGNIHIVKVGVTTITATQAGNSMYLPTISAQTLTVSLQPAPTIAYSGAQSYTVNTAITPLTPTNTGGAVPATVYGQVSTFAGSGKQANNNGTGTAAGFYEPYGLTTDASGNVYVAD